jgi:magnesium-transporting ATPase (P-type)
LDPIILLLIVAIIASLIVGEFIDAGAIFMIITVDLILGTVQEKKANNTAEALSNLVREKIVSNFIELLSLSLVSQRLTVILQAIECSFWKIIVDHHDSSISTMIPNMHLFFHS